MYKIIAVLLISISILLIPDQSVVNAQTTQTTNIRVWFVRKDPITGSPIWKNGVVGVFDPVNDGLPNPRPIPFETDYLPNVVTKELDVNEYSARASQAIAARTYALWFVNNRPSYCNDADPSKVCDVTDSTSHQDYRPNFADDLGRQVVNDTIGVYLTHPPTSSSAPIFAEFSSDHSPDSQDYPAADYYTNDGAASYLKSVYDPISNGEESSSGHGHGLSQWGAVKWGRGSNSSGERFPKWDFTQILAHYYTNVQLVNGSGTPYWGSFRWNMLSYSPSNDIYYVGESKNITLRLQNTGLNTWEPGTRMVVSWRRTSYTGQYSQYGPFPSVTVPSRAPGEDVQVSLNLTPPANVFIDSSYTYQLIWDLQRPDQSFFTSQGWIAQNWAIRLKKRVNAPVAPPPPCSRLPCAQNTPSGSVIWDAVDHPDPVSYRWRRVAGATTLTGNTSATNIQVPLEVGLNNLYVKAVDTTESQNTSAETLVYQALYDPNPPLLTSPALARWSNAQTLSLTWTGSDDLSGIQSYYVEQQTNGGAWITVLFNSTATQYTTGVLVNNTDYSFRITANDWAGNTKQVVLSTTIDRDPPNSLLTTPIDSIGKTWAFLKWNSSFDRAPITKYTIDRLISGIWQPWRVVSDSSTTLLEGQPSTTYSFRIRAQDAAGNSESPHAIADITFTTGTDTSGLSRRYAPGVYKDQQLPPADEPYPLPTSP
jgi:hypothetical protein